MIDLLLRAQEKVMYTAGCTGLAAGDKLLRPYGPGVVTATPGPLLFPGSVVHDSFDIHAVSDVSFIGPSQLQRAGSARLSLLPVRPAARSVRQPSLPHRLQLIDTTLARSTAVVSGWR
jgi:hypothetical protein